MKETVLDVLMYLLENYQHGEFANSDQHATLRDELIAAGFPGEEVDSAFRWLDGLAQQRQLPLIFGPTGSLRVYARQEHEKLSTDCRGFLLYMEQLGLLTPVSREHVIDRLMALEEGIDLERVKWVCLLVLMNEPEAEQAFAQVEGMLSLDSYSLH